jgi:hypothetical protein
MDGKCPTAFGMLCGMIGDGTFALRPVTTARVKHCASSYLLPPSFSPGDAVTILSFDTGYYLDEKGGIKHRIFVMNMCHIDVLQNAQSSATISDFSKPVCRTHI